MVPPSVFDERFDSPCGLFDGGVFADSRRRFVGVFGAFGLLVTLVWLYIEILNILAKVNNRN